MFMLKIKKYIYNTIMVIAIIALVVSACVCIFHIMIYFKKKYSKTN
jgi:hypothetical protein